MKFLCLLCSLTGIVSVCFAQDPMLDIDMLFPERAATADRKPVSDSSKTDTAGGSHTVSFEGEQSVQELFRRIDRLEREMESVKRELQALRSAREDIFPSVDRQMYARALRHFTAGEYNKAAELLRKVQEETSEAELSLSALYWLGECAFRLNNFNESVVLLQELLSEDTELFRENALILTAVCFRKLGKDNEAILYFKRYLDEFPESKYSTLARRELEKTSDK